MNKQRRADLARAIELIEDARQIVSEAASEEQDGFDNLPEGIQQGDRGVAIETAAETLCFADDEFATLIDTINEGAQ
jgi:hypothetical protein